MSLKHKFMTAVDSKAKNVAILNNKEMNNTVKTTANNHYAEKNLTFLSNAMHIFSP